MLSLFLAVVFLTFHEALSEQCVCATQSVHIRDGVGRDATVLTTLPAHHCLQFKGHHKPDVAGANWANVNYNGHDGWIHESYVTISTMTDCSGTSTSHTTPTSHINNPHLQLSGCPPIVTRAEWGARATRYSNALTHTPRYMFIHHGASADCHTKAECIHQMHRYQNYHMDGHGWADIAYSFLVGEDGNVYEGRGWDRQGGHTKGYNDLGLAICVIGNFMERPPNQAALTAVQQMVDCAHKNGKITSNYILMGHRDVRPTACPGVKFYDIIQHWPHYSSHTA